MKLYLIRYSILLPIGRGEIKSLQWVFSQMNGWWKESSVSDILEKFELLTECVI